MKKLFIVIITLALLLAACQSTPTKPGGEEAPNVPESKPPPVFHLEALPELTPYQAQEEIAERYYDDLWVDELRPSGDYGMLYPYMGRIVGEGEFYGEYRYGLADASGRIVVDPVYQYADYAWQRDSGEPAYLTIAYPVDAGDTVAFRRMVDTNSLIRRGRYQFASVDGNWVSPMFYADEAYISGDRIIVMDYGKDMALIERHIDDLGLSENNRYSIYDLEERLLASDQGFLWAGFSDGLAEVRHGYYDEESGEYRDYYDYIDRNGQLAIPGPFIYADSFVNGRAHVIVGETPEYRTHALIDKEGNVLQTSTNWDDIQNEYATVTQPPALRHADNENIIESRYLADNVYSVRTTLMSGLMTADGEWLLRIFVNNLD